MKFQLQTIACILVNMVVFRTTSVVGNFSPTFTIDGTTVTSSSITVMFTRNDDGSTFTVGNAVISGTGVTTAAKLLTASDTSVTFSGLPSGTALTVDFTFVYSGQSDVRASGSASTEPSYTWATSSGDPHYVTFDGKRFNFNGVGTFQLAGTTQQAINDIDQNSSSLNSFLVKVEQYKLTKQSPIAYIKRIIISIEKNNIILFGSHACGQAEVNGKEVAIPYDENTFAYQIYCKNNLLVFKSHFGLKIRYDVVKRIASVGLSKKYANQVEGLYGNFNGNKDDDFAMKGTGEIVDDVNKFAESYRLD